MQGQEVQQPQAQVPTAATACRVLAGLHGQTVCSDGTEMIYYVASMYAASWYKPHNHMRALQTPGP